MQDDWRIGVINRQARLLGAHVWKSYGNCSFFTAIKWEAIQASRQSKFPEYVWVVQCRCESEPDVIDEFEVRTTLQAEVLNPRKGD